ncbi:sodium:solute symporter family protein [Lysinibacillus endophyticus]|uniref:sodium:solute symporter family protein n=1 Tax=Ureibacillus endophyticus TaxID=1978490 RepID=UPI00313565C6
MIGYKVWAIASLIIYFGVLLILSLNKKGNKSNEDFFLAGRSFPHWALALTFVASWFGGTSALVSIDQAFEEGISAWWIIGSPSVLAAIVLIFFAKFIRNVGSISQRDIMEKRYSKTAGFLVSIIVIWYMITFASSQTVALGKFFSTMFGTSYLTAILIGVAIVAIYASIGGFRAVVLTDIAQFFLFTLGLIITTVVAFKYSGGLDNILAVTQQPGKENYLNFFANFKQNFFYMLSFGMAWIISADAWQRISATKNVKEAKMMPFGGFLIFIPLYILVAIIGIAAGAIYTSLPEGGIVAALTLDYLHPFLGMVVFLGIASAIMSTMSTAINSGALYASDFYTRYINPNADGKKMVQIGIISTLLISLIASIVALRIPDTLWVLWLSSDILAVGVVTPLLASFLWRRGTSIGAVTSIIVGSSFVLYNFLIDLGFKLPLFWPNGTERILIGIGLSLFTFVIVSLLTKPEYDKADQLMTAARVDDMSTEANFVSIPEGVLAETESASSLEKK